MKKKNQQGFTQHHFNKISNNTRSGAGFTLIELMVVISITSLLSTVVSTAVGTARERAQDVKRVVEKNEVIKALQFYYDENGTFPATTSWVCIAPSSETCDLGMEAGSDALVAALAPYLPVLPTNNAPVGIAAHDRLIYCGNSQICEGGADSGAVLIWAQATEIASADCPSSKPNPVKHWDAWWYCIQYLGE